MSRYRDFDKALLKLELTPLQQSAITDRFIPLVSHIRYRTSRVSCMFHTSRVIVTVGSLIVPALLSIQGATVVNTQIYWITWVISLMVTICNALMALFKFDKRYYYLHTVLEKLITEGWQYIELTGRYSGYHTPGLKPTHDNQFIYFCHAIEKTRMKQVEEEYYKLSDSQTQAPGTQIVTQDAKLALIPPTPQQGELSSIPKDVQLRVKEEVAKGLSQTIVADAAKRTKNNATQTDGEEESVSVFYDV